jgi:hypothetical protein
MLYDLGPAEHSETEVQYDRVIAIEGRKPKLRDSVE